MCYGPCSTQQNLRRIIDATNLDEGISVLPPHRSVWLPISALAVACLFLASCAQEPPDPPETQAERLAKVRNAIGVSFTSPATDDIAAFKEHTFTRSGEEAATDAGFELMQLMYKLKDELEKKFGDDALQKLDKNGSGKGFSLKLTPADPAWVQDLEIEFLDAKTAVTTNPFTDRHVYVVKHKGRWLVDHTYEFQRPFDPQELVNTCRVFAQAHAKAIEACKRDGSTIEEVAKAAVGEIFVIEEK